MSVLCTVAVLHNTRLLTRLATSSEMSPYCENLAGSKFIQTLHHLSIQPSCETILSYTQYSANERASLLTKCGPLQHLLFPSLKIRFNNVETAEHNVTELPVVISKTEFHRCFQHWQED